MGILDEVSEICRDYDLTPIVDVIFGLPGETVADQQETLELVEFVVNKDGRIHSHYFISPPGTPLEYAVPLSVGKDVNREKELAFLGNTFDSDRAEFIVIYGRRRIGKTELIKFSRCHDEGWERGKLIKDYADILALIDPEYGGAELEIELLGKKLDELGFLRNCLYNRLFHFALHLYSAGQGPGVHHLLRMSLS